MWSESFMSLFEVFSEEESSLSSYTDFIDFLAG